MVQPWVVVLVTLLGALPDVACEFKNVTTPTNLRAASVAAPHGSPVEQGVPAATSTELGSAAPLVLEDERRRDEHRPEDDTDTTTTGDLGDQETDTTTPAPRTTPAILESILQVVSDELRSSRYQGADAAVASLLGLTMVLNGEFVFKWFVVGLVFLVTAITVMSQISASWDLGKDDPVRKIVGFEAGAIAAYGAFVGFDGVQLVAGALIGVLFASRSDDFLREHGLEFMGRKWVIVSYFSVFALVLALLFRKKRHLSALAFISPALGGALLTSGLAFGVTELAVKGYLQWLQTIFPDLEPQGGPWLDFLYLMWSTDSKDVGLFAGSPYNFNVSGKEWHVDRVAGCWVWFLLFVAGASVQFRRIKKMRANPVTSPNQEPLLPGRQEAGK